MPRPVVRNGVVVASVGGSPALRDTTFPSPSAPPNWFTIPSYNSPIMNPVTGTLGVPWYNLLVFISTRASFIDQLFDGLNTANDNITIIQGQISTLQGQVSNLQGRMNTAEANISALQSQMTTANNNIASLQGRMNTAESNITNLQGRVSSLEGRVTTIENRLAAAGIP